MKETNWINTSERLPEAGKYVLGRYNGRNWHDSTDQENVNCVVVKLVKGISVEEREKMKNGEIPSEPYGYISANGKGETDRWLIYTRGDQEGNNKVPYAWETFGPSNFFGQQITSWAEIPK